MLILHGENDRIVPLWNSERLIRGPLTGAKLKVLPGVAHTAHEEDPETVAREIVGCLDDSTKAL